VGLFGLFVGLFGLFVGLFGLFVGLFGLFVGLFGLFVGLFGLFSCEKQPPTSNYSVAIRWGLWKSAQSPFSLR
jgi:hypothetical protein